MIRPVLASLSAAVALFAPAAEHNLRVFPAKGEVYRYKMAGTIKIQGGETSIGMNVTETIMEAGNEGWTVDVATTDGLAKFDAQQVDLPPSRQTITYGIDGLIKEMKMPEGTTSEAYRIIQMAALFRPEQRVSEGVEFIHDFPSDAARGVPAARATYKAVESEVWQEIPTIKIEFKYAELTGDNPARNSGTMWLHRDKGVVVRLVQNWANAPVAGSAGSGGSSSVTGTFTTELVPAADQ